jgi:type II secretory pathway pseudopilin PulG
MTGQRGFTIIEALIALVLLIGVMLALLAIVPAVFHDASRDSQRSQAVDAAQQYLDTLREYTAYNAFTAASLPSPAPANVDAGDSFAGGASIGSTAKFTLVNNGCPKVAGSVKMAWCVVTVTWTQDGSTRTADVESYVTQQI